LNLTVVKLFSLS